MVSVLQWSSSLPGRRAVSFWGCCFVHGTVPALKLKGCFPRSGPPHSSSRKEGGSFRCIDAADHFMHLILLAPQTTTQEKYECLYVFNVFIFNWRLYYIVLVFATRQHESATGLHMSPPSWTSLPPPSPSHPLGHHRAPGLSSLRLRAHSHWLSVLHMVMFMFQLLSQVTPPSPSTTISTSLFLMSASPLLPCK